MRDLVQIEHLYAATASDLLDGMRGFKPHVVHFSWPANWNVLAFDTPMTVTTEGQYLSADRVRTRSGSGRRRLRRSSRTATPTDI